MQKPFGKNINKAWQQLVVRAAKDPFFLGWALREYRMAHGLNEKRLAEWLECDPKALNQLKLCRLPADEENRFQQKVQQIAEFVHCNADRLIQLMREVFAFSSLRKETKGTSRFLMAARDRRLPKKEKKD